MTRPYTGFDKYGTGAAPGVVALRDLILFVNAGKLTHLGTYGRRDARGKPGHPSVHGTGRAVDIGFTDRATVELAINWLITHADTLGVEMIADYFPQPFGRAWRCDRGTWKIYDKLTIHGAPGGRWIHIEISPTMAWNAAAMNTAIESTIK